MSVNVICPSCRNVLLAPPTQLEHRVRCGACKDLFVARRHSLPADTGDVPVLPIQGTVDDQSGNARISLVLGIVGLVAWLLPIVGLPVTIFGLHLGAKGQKSASAGLASAGIALSFVGLLLSAANAALGAYLGATGQHPLFR